MVVSKGTEFRICQYQSICINERWVLLPTLQGKSKRQASWKYITLFSVVKAWAVQMKKIQLHLLFVKRAMMPFIVEKLILKKKGKKKRTTPSCDANEQYSHSTAKANPCRRNLWIHNERTSSKFWVAKRTLL